MTDGADGETEAGEIQQNQNITYDLSKLVNYPGFNISTPRGIPDVSILFSYSFEMCRLFKMLAYVAITVICRSKSVT